MLASTSPHPDSPFWSPVGNGKSRLLFGDGDTADATICAHDFRVREEADWARSFQPGTLEVCLNAEGNADVERGRCQMRFADATLGYFIIGDGCGAGPASEVMPCRAGRAGRQRHEFISIRFALDALRRRLEPDEAALNPGVRRSLFGGNSTPGKSLLQLHARPMRQRDRDFYRSLLDPPESPQAAPHYYRAKVLEFLATTFFSGSDEVGEEFFCLRQKRIAGERVERVRKLLSENLDDPPDLETLGRSVGCSPFYLSRIFSETTGMTISRYMRKIRIEEAARHLTSGRFNVGEAAVEVGYQSLSHFSKAFKEVMGCHPSRYSG